MSIPLDRLYHYIESVAQDISNGNILIYRFFPHGAKKLINLSWTRDVVSWFDRTTKIDMYCHDQEPLCFSLYHEPFTLDDLSAHIKNNKNTKKPHDNLRKSLLNIHDSCLLLHSELRSLEVKQYQQSQFVTVYYWSHGLIARDWYRYSEFDSTLDKPNKPRKFLVYNRAWSGTREYRLKLLDLLIESDLINKCQTSCSFVDPQTNIHYKNHKFTNPTWAPVHTLEDYVKENTHSAESSADYNNNDYINTDFELVLETLYDDERLHLTEKSLRPIACGQPFIIAGTYGSLEYLRRYGFKTFSDVFDESYDLIKDPMQRMHAIVATMKTISNWSEIEYNNAMKKIKAITEYNRRYFFSSKFFNCITDELHENLKIGVKQVEDNNTSQLFFSRLKYLAQDDNLRKLLTTTNSVRTREEIHQAIILAKKYQMRNQ